MISTDRVVCVSVQLPMRRRSCKSTTQFPLISPTGQPALTVRKDSIGGPTKDTVNTRVSNEIFIVLRTFFSLTDVLGRWPRFCLYNLWALKSQLSITRIRSILTYLEELNQPFSTQITVPQTVKKFFKLALKCYLLNHFSQIQLSL